LCVSHRVSPPSSIPAWAFTSRATAIKKIELEDTSPSSVSYLSPFAEHPQQLGADVTEFPSPTEYYVPVRDLKSETAPQITVAYRSSMKKFQARWVGDWPDRFAASVKLDPDDARLPISGRLTNGTGVDLSEVYLAFNAGGDKDWMIYVPTWPKNTTYDIKREFRQTAAGRQGTRGRNARRQKNPQRRNRRNLET